MEEDSLFPSFDVDVEGILRAITRNGYTKVLLQCPEGMKPDMLRLAGILEERSSVQVWVDGEPCYGACDHAGERALVLGADALIHLGHSDIPSMERDHSVPLHFFPVTMKREDEMIRGGIGKIASILSGNRVSLFTTIQHMDLIDEVGSILKEKGIKVHVGDPGSREMFPGQVLGCSFNPAKDLPEDVESLLFIGTGRFHPLGLTMVSKRDVHTMDPLTGEIGLVGKEDLDRMLRSRFGQISRFKDLLINRERVGIVIGFKPGQRRLDLAERIAGSLKELGHGSRMVVMDHMEPMKLRSMGLKAVVNTACPRIALDDAGRYSEEGITVLTPVELDIALGKESWADYSFDDVW